MWSPSKEDVKSVCEAVTSNYLDSNSVFTVSCMYCYRQLDESFLDIEMGTEIKETHNSCCPVLKARDILTRITDKEK